MEDIAKQVLQDYGFASLLVLMILAFAIVLVHKILYHFMDSITAKDSAILKMGEKFSCSIDDHSKALHELSKTYFFIANDSKNAANCIERLSNDFDRLEEKNTEEHGRIMDHIMLRKH